jgi:phage baseplate assembly protein W
MATPQFDNPHWGFPFTRGLYVEQDTVEHVVACEARVVSTPIGSRVEKPEFGIPWPMFDNIPIDLGGISAAMQKWEPRGDANPSQYTDLINQGIAHVRYDVSIQTE